MQFFVKTCVLLVAIGLSHGRPRHGGHGGYNIDISGQRGHAPFISGQTYHQFDNGVRTEAHGQSYDGGRHNAIGGSVGYTHEITKDVNVYGNAGIDRGYNGKTQQNYEAGIEIKI
ncbi:uncharacterized protein LOC122859388 [Aphidius gifuensis]|uniref:uncharacterized protein LOC122859388 n=1 Tax=Aphidius gifuensis TaxID=684658 RepID=UPI001CDD8E25|nr:uncharacterized protein LOC122859388 [Aphidius gifuensis]XP_044018880.1 uncharacterized protein LOC122859388 [Aphidius gifuensis]